jgi:hypothetical protein
LAAKRAVVDFEKPLSAQRDFAPNEFADKLNSLTKDKQNCGCGRKYVKAIISS